MSVNTSTNMLLPIPVVGVEPGPQFASDINNSLTIIDAHNHSAGSGVPINPAGLNINSDLTFGNNNATSLRSVRFTAQGAPLAAATDLGCLYESGVDLYYNDGSGNQVRITQSGGVAGSFGSIAGLSSPASATYVAGSQTFVWQSAANTPANLDAASVIIRKLVASGKGITLSTPTAIASDYTLTLPALPASQKFMTLDATGNISAPWSVDNSTLVISSNLIQIPSNVNLSGKAVTENGNNVVVSNTNATNSLAIIRAVISSIGTLVGGEGVTPVSFASGVLIFTFDVPFADAPVIIANSIVSGFVCSNTAVSVNGAAITTYNAAGGTVNQGVNILVIGQRA